MTNLATSDDGAAIAYEAHGTGEPAIVLVHGWSCDRSYWSAQTQALAPTNLVLALDLAGHGDSQCSRRDWTMVAYATDVAAVVHQAAPQQCILVGHSMGADVVLEAARLLPGRVLGMIWVDQYTDLPILRSEAEVAARVASFSANFATTTVAFVRAMFSRHAAPELVDRVSKHMASAPRHVALSSLEATWNHARVVPALLDEVELPVLAINASSALAGRASLHRHGIQVIEMPDAGHFPMLEQPAKFNVLLVQAIKQLSRPEVRDAS